MATRVLEPAKQLLIKGRNLVYRASHETIQVNQDYYTLPQAELEKVKYDDLCIQAPVDTYVMKDFNDPALNAVLQEGLTPNQAEYRENGCVIKRGFIPEEICDAYIDLRDQLMLGDRQFSNNTPYIEHKEVRKLVCYQPLMDLLQELHSCSMGLIFNLSMYKSTERGWHPDAYLDRDDAIPRVAVWIALGDIDKNCGPFEYLPGSHRWPALSNQRINEYMKSGYQWPEAHRHRRPGVPGWGKLAEALVSPAVERKITQEGQEPKKFIASKGDVLVWYARLMHRGSEPNDESALRPAMIGHYAPIFERERGLFAKTPEGGYFLVPPHRLEQLSR